MEDLYIDTPDGLDALCARLRHCEWLALDTEFIRERTFYPRLCLLQVASEELVACVDPLALPHLDPLLELIFDPRVTKVMHSARQDMEIFYMLKGTPPAPVFDTQVAATVLGYGDQIGYGALVKLMLGVDLDKGQARTDWSRRPLDEDQIRYASDDVRYLRLLYQQQVALLAEKGRRGWLDEDFKELTALDSYQVIPTEAWRRVKGAGRLKGVQLAVLRAVTAWREEQAVRSDKPRRWILKDELLIEIARLMPETVERLEKLRGIEGGTVNRYGETIVEQVKAAKQEPRAAWPVMEEIDRLSPDQDVLVDALQALLRQKAVEHGVSPLVVATRSELEEMVMGRQDLPLLHGWRAAIAGNELRRFLEGETTLSVKNGHITIDVTDGKR